MMSSMPSLMLQILGFHGFHHTYLFVDDNSVCTLVHHQTSTLVDETIKAKYAYEAYLRKYG